MRFGGFGKKKGTLCQLYHLTCQKGFVCQKFHNKRFYFVYRPRLKFFISHLCDTHFYMPKPNNEVWAFLFIARILTFLVGNLFCLIFRRNTYFNLLSLCIFYFYNCNIILFSSFYIQRQYAFEYTVENLVLFQSSFEALP